MSATLIVLLAALIGLAASKDAFDDGFHLCSKSTAGRSFDIPQPVDCRMDIVEDSDVVNVEIEVYAPRMTPELVPAYKCNMITQRVCTNTDIVGFFTSRVNETTTAFVSPPICRAIFESKQHNGEELHELNNKTWSTTKRSVADYQSYFQNCESTTHMLLQVGVAGSIDGISVMSDLGTISSCVASAGQCHTNDGIILWKPNSFNNLCQFEPVGRHKAQISGDLVVIDELMTALTLVSTTNVCNLTGAFATGQGSVVKFGGHSNNDRTTKKFETEMIESTWTDDDYEASNINNDSATLKHVLDAVARLERQQFRNNWRRLCTLTNQNLRVARQFLQIDPTVGARLLFQRQDIHASFVGSSLMVWPCSKVRPDVVFWNHTADGRCYDLLPVRIGERLWFVAPFSKDLVPSAVPVACLNHRPGVYYRPSLGADISPWHTSQGPVHVSKVSVITMLKHATGSGVVFEPPATFDTGDDSLSPSVAQLFSYLERTKLLEVQTSRLTEVAAYRSLDHDSALEVLRRPNSTVTKVTRSQDKTVVRAKTDDKEQAFFGEMIFNGGIMQFFVNHFVIGIALVPFIILLMTVLAALRKKLKKGIKALVRKLKSKSGGGSRDGHSAEQAADKKRDKKHDKYDDLSNVYDIIEDLLVKLRTKNERRRRPNAPALPRAELDDIDKNKNK